MSNATWTAVRRAYVEHEERRREVVTRGDEAVRRAKKAIFALHRDDVAEAKAMLAETAKLLASCDAALRAFPDLRGEGPYAAGLEEYAEALLFLSYVEKGTFGAIDKRAMVPTVYLAGLCDATGEAVRFAMREATAGRHEAVREAFDAVEGAITYLLDMDLTGYLRTKFDQAKRNLRTLEQMTYDQEMRKR